jgi:hypothetical protein
MEFGDEDFSGGDSIIIRLGNSSWGVVAGQDSEDEDENDVETMRNNPLALLLQWFNRSSRITRSQTAQQTSEKESKKKAKKKSAKEKPECSFVNQPVPRDEDIYQNISTSCGWGGRCATNGLFQKLVEREYGLGYHLHRMSKSTEKRAISEHCLPRVTTKNQVVHMSRSSVFCGKYSADGNMLALACQDGSIPVYWTQGESFRHRCTIQARYIGWTVIEVAFSPDHTHLCYGTWSPLLHHCSLAGDEITQTPLDLRPPEDSFATFGIFYTPDGASVAASGSDGCVYVYDLCRQERVLKIPAHEDHANALCCSRENPSIMYSGGDDGLCRIWDRRETDEKKARAVGLFAGHRDGLTFIDAKSDGRYIITNSKDQSVKLWDLRKFSPPEGILATRNAVARQQWDYRWQLAPNKCRLDADCSYDSSTRYVCVEVVCVPDCRGATLTLCSSTQCIVR